MTARLTHLLRATAVALALFVGALATLTLLTPHTVANEALQRVPLTVVTAAGPTVFKVEIADTDAKRETGLMYRKMLPADEGMLFDFQTTEPVYFWMKNTIVPLDMIFIRADGTIARIAERTVPFSERTVPSVQPVRFVLEVVAGTAARLGLKAGDRIETALVSPSGQ